MDVAKILVELRQEREQIEEAIMSLERLARGRGKRRGRPPAWMTEVKRRGRPPGSKNKPKVEKAGASAKAAAA
jgi:DNA invertase Pin-like site-specific DNA recombinase